MTNFPKAGFVPTTAAALGLLVSTHAGKPALADTGSAALASRTSSAAMSLSVSAPATPPVSSITVKPASRTVRPAPAKHAHVAKPAQGKVVDGVVSRPAPQTPAGFSLSLPPVEIFPSDHPDAPKDVEPGFRGVKLLGVKF
jgi:hypothetical protein